MASIALRNRCDAAVEGRPLVDRPRIKSRISSEMSGEVLEGDDGLLIQGAEIGDIAFIEGSCIFGEHHIAIIRSSGSRHPRAVAPDEFFFLGCLDPSGCSWLVERLTPSLQSGSP